TMKSKPVSGVVFDQVDTVLVAFEDKQTDLVCGIYEIPQNAMMSVPEGQDVCSHRWQNRLS
ncbi:hypothetical protein, partial [Gluconobacter thailandicus]|uniref:hypothetical protein n=1 Tax=Gluconobacter thailandicus TaxID=257438 RepID=UPI00190543FB